MSANDMILSLEKSVSQRMAAFEAKLKDRLNQNTIKPGEANMLNKLKAEFDEFRKLVLCRINDIKLILTKAPRDVNDLNAYSGRNCLVVHGVEEKSNENIVGVVKSIFAKCNINEWVLNDEMIDRCHRLGKKIARSKGANKKQKRRPIIVKFLSYHHRSKTVSSGINSGNVVNGNKPGRKSRKEKALADQLQHSGGGGNASSQENSPTHKLHHHYQNEILPLNYSSNNTANVAANNKPVECLVCSDLAEDNVRLEPCGHKPACEDCSARLKKCLQCSTAVRRRVTKDGRLIQPAKSRQPSAERMRYLECKIAEIEESHACSICMERKRNVVFLCGHGACAKCADTLKTCHMCRKTITKKIPVY